MSLVRDGKQPADLLVVMCMHHNAYTGLIQYRTPLSQVQGNRCTKQPLDAKQPLT